jgi:hypothetical protein
MILEQALVFGGLSACGQPLSEALVDKGITVHSLSSAICPEEETSEEERRYILGRNALFHTVESPVFLQCDTILIADAFRVDRNDNRLLQERLHDLINAGVWGTSRKVIILSSLEAASYERSGIGRAAEHVPLSAEGKAAGEMEDDLIQASSAAGQNNLIIFRTDLSAMKRRGGRGIRILAELYSTGCQGLKHLYFDEYEEGLESEGNKTLRLLLGDRFPGND